RAYFEHLIVKAFEANDWNWTFNFTGKKDAEDLAKESLPVKLAVEEVINKPALSHFLNHACTAPYDTDERAGSPLADDIYTRSIQVMQDKVSALGLIGIEGLKATRRILSAGSVAEIGAGKALKVFLRFYGEQREI
ncbi:hypothetical protein BG015_010830, partial [Linnemannia schmuckeri]